MTGGDVWIAGCANAPRLKFSCSEGVLRMSVETSIVSSTVPSTTSPCQRLTADQVCFHPGIRKQMAPRYTQSRDVSRDKILLQPSLQDKDTIFKLANNPKDFVDIQKKLQTLDFNVNTECDNAGDFLLHIAVRKGLAQLPLLMALVKIQGADIELCNADGMTPLMLTAAVGNCVLCDVLICLFGADPNKPNPQSGQSALHYAAEGNHRKTVECLIRRGADVNIEAHDGLRPDDIPACLAATDDCREIIAFNRVQRLEMLSELVRKGEVVSTQLLPSDLCVVDSDGHTLVMVAAIHNRFQTLHNLLEVSQATINAQHSRTGMTVLGIAAQMGNVDTISVLLRHDANPTIADMNGYLPLHHAVLHNHEHAVDVFLDHFPKSYVGLHKAVRLCKKTSIHLKLKAAWEKRQEEIVTPKMLGCALNGDAGELFLLLDEGDNINPKSGTGNWPLYLAVENGHLDVLKLLCERGGDIRKRHPTTGATALHVAAKMGHQTIVSYLLGYCRQSIESKSMFDSAPALNAAGGSSGMHSMSRSSSGFIKSPGSQRSLDSPEKPREYRKLLDINAVDRDNKTALQLAAERGYSRIVELLLFHGATTAMLDAEGQLVTCRQYEGVRIMIESHRQQHTRQVIKCVMDKSRKALALLQQIWLPKFDHHLRNKEGDTPLMVAAATGRLPIIRFLLESAVYPEVAQYESDCADDSDADSGVLDPTSSSSKDPLKQDDEFQTSHDVSSSIFTGPEFVSDTRFERASSPQVQVTTGLADSTELFYQTRLSRIVNDANRPKGLSIYHDGLISHVCAVNLTTGYTALHHAVRGAGDIPQVLSLLLEYDPTPINVQDNRGETAIHLACKLGRKKCVEMLLARSDIDLNVRTLEGHLPEEVANLKTIHKMIERQRMFMPAPVESGLLTPHDGGSIGGSDRSPSITGSTVNFEKVHSRYEALKQGSALDRAS
ncbi:ankyrin-3 [Aplysia californica]|uniref:Ankyrin-3 n=1 Tax=Aplysia californica TaxID=6500 RepID=A0ABM0JPC3_APLCA|nr:ankyrin-3 [Aplysia californica]